VHLGRPVGDGSVPLNALVDLIRVSTGARTSSSLSYLLAGVHSSSSTILSRVSKMSLRAVSSIWMALSTGFSALLHRQVQRPQRRLADQSMDYTLEEVDEELQLLAKHG
jgi:hypothetical protein